MHVDTSSRKLKFDQKNRGGHGQKWTWPGKSQDSEIQEWVDGRNWYFACRCKYRKTKSYFKDFWVGIVRNGHGHLVHETLEPAVSKEWVHEFSWFLACWLWRSNFWLDQHHTLYLWLLNASLLQLYLLDPYQ